MVVILIMDNSKTPTVYSFIYYVFLCVCVCSIIFVLWAFLGAACIGTFDTGQTPIFHFCFVGFFRGGVYWNLRYWPNPHFSR